MNLLQSIAAALSRKPGRTRPARSARERRAATPFKRTLLAESIEQRVLLAADPLSVARVNGSVDSAGEVDHFSFHLDNVARLSFDSLTENGNLHWNLVGPAGAVVNGASFRGFSGSDGNYAPLDLGAGDYRVDVYGSGDTTGAYDMRLLDLARATPIALDSVVSGSVDQAGQTLAFTFDAHAGDNLYLTWQQHPDAYLRLYDPYGQQVNSNYGGGQYYDSAVPTLAYTGRYTLLLDASGGVPAGAGYGFTLHRMVTPVTEAGTWNSAVLPFSGTLAGAGDNAVLHFTLGSARSVMLDSFTWNDSMLLSMSGPQGQVVDSFGQAVANVPMGNYVDRSVYARGRLDLAAGDYTVVLRGNAGTTGPRGGRHPGLAETACTAWREADPTAVLDPIELSPKILRACTSAAMPRALETAAPEPSAPPPRSLLRRDGGR